MQVMRKSDNAMTDMMTGGEAVFYLDSVLPLTDAGFDAEAETLDYD